MTPSELRLVLDKAALTQRGAAKVLHINERTMRRYIAGDLEIPHTVELALNWVTHEAGRSSNAKGKENTRKGCAPTGKTTRAKQVD